MTAWKTYVWLTFVGLMASTVNWAAVMRDANGKIRWGALALQIPVAFSIGVMSHDLLMPLAKHVLPELSEGISYGFASLLSFMGPLSVQRLFDAAMEKARVSK